jgi:ABC-2 type transport system permease protein
MTARRTGAIARKEFIQIIRDSRSLAIVLAMPVMLMVLLGYGVNLDVKHLPLVIFDRERSQASQDLIHRFKSSQYFKTVAEVGDYAALQGEIDRGDGAIAIVIPHDFSERIQSSQATSIQAIADGTDANTAQISIGYAQAIVGAYANELQAAFFARRRTGAPPAVITVEARTWFNEDLESRNFIVPGVAAVVLTIIGTLLTSLTIAREWERGTMEQLISTPVTAMEIIAGKLIPYFAIGMADAVVCVAMARWWFEVPFRGSLAMLGVGAALYLTVVLTLGFLISVITRNQLAASQFSLLSGFLPAMMLSGFTFEIEQMPRWIQIITRLISPRYFVTIIKGAFLKGSGFREMAAPMSALAIYATVMVVLAVRSFHKRLE